MKKGVKMVLLKEIEEEKEVDIEIDYYVPFSITIINKNRYQPKIYWRMGNIKTSLNMSISASIDLSLF